jgi:hypothetical protein
VKIGQQAELFLRVTNGLEEGDEGGVFGVHELSGLFTGCALVGDAIA